MGNRVLRKKIFFEKICILFNTDFQTILMHKIPTNFEVKILISLCNFKFWSRIYNLMIVEIIDL